MIVAALIALGFQLLNLNLSPAIDNLLIWTSAIGGTVGRLIVGWLTTRHRVFPAWVGWGLIVEGLLSLIGLIDLGSFVDVYSTIVILVGVIALLGYGFYLLRPRATPAMA
jgi:hypothetical protein